MAQQRFFPDISASGHKKVKVVSCYDLTDAHLLHPERVQSITLTDVRNLEEALPEMKLNCTHPFFDF